MSQTADEFGQWPASGARAPSRHERERAYRWVKRATDLCAALLLAALFAPVLISAALLLRRSGQACLSLQPCIGRGGLPFTAYRFRAPAQAPQADPLFDGCPDPEDETRAIAPGALLRQSGLDELPLLWNVLRGEMSLVGPAPMSRLELRQQPQLARWYARVKPGLSGLWPADATPRRRAAALRHYARHACLRYDLWLFGNMLRETLRRA